MDVKSALELIKSLRKDTTSQGVSTSSNVNFYFLEPQAKTIYPVYYPLLASIPRVNPMYGGVRVGGTAVNWKAIVAIGPGSNGYVGLSEGNRGSAVNFTERDYSSNYKYIGWDDFVTFQAQFSGLGFDDNLALAQSATLNQVLNDEERMILFGNSGTGGNGFQLGACGTVTIAGPTAGGSVPNTDTIYVSCMALTGWGVTMAAGQVSLSTPAPVVGAAAKLPFVRTTMNGAQDLINGGTSAMSALAGPSSAATSSNGTFSASVAAIKGAMGYIWYVGTGGTLATSYCYGFTSVPSVSITALPTSAQQNAAASSSSGNFTTDNSANTLDFDGLTTWTFNAGTWTDLAGANLTSNGDGTIAQFETVQDNLWSQYKIPINKIWLGGTLIDAVTKKIQGAGIANNVSRWVGTVDQAGNIRGGAKASQYLCKYGRNAGQGVPIETHPWLPQGVIFFELLENPYPQAANSIPATRRIVTLEDHFSIKWPYVTLQHQFGVYSFQTMEVYIPFGQSILTSVGNN
jgi:hypothetical protein